MKHAVVLILAVVAFLTLPTSADAQRSPDDPAPAVTPAAAAATTQATANPTPTATSSTRDWRLVWSDEFDQDGLPEPKRWTYEQAFVRNEEAQYYTADRLENARVENGVLVIEGRKESFPNAQHQAGSSSWKTARARAEYTSASLITLGRASWLYGRVEVRAKLPAGRGMWPAIWMMGVNRTEVGWPACGEIDVMEFVGKHPNRVHGTVHFPVEKGHRSNGGRHDVEAPSAAFHVYAVEWFADRLDFYFDDVRYHSFKIDDAGAGPDNPFRKPHYLLINLALGGSWGGPIDDAVLPQRYVVDYVRVFQDAARLENSDAIKRGSPGR